MMFLMMTMKDHRESGWRFLEMANVEVNHKNVKRLEIDDDDSRRLTADASRVVKVFHNDDEFCDFFLQSTIFDAFKERLQVASVFNYNVNLDVILRIRASWSQPVETSGGKFSMAADEPRAR